MRALERRVLLLVEKSDSARIETVVAANYLNLAGINFSLENRRRGAQRFHHVFHIGFDRCLQIVFRVASTAGLMAVTNDSNMPGCFAFRSDGLHCCLDGTATLMAEHQNQAAYPKDRPNTRCCPSLHH